MKNKVAFIIPYFGKIPSYSKFFFESTKHNLDFDFIFFTDSDEIPNLPNVFVKQMQFDEFKRLASLKIGVKVNFSLAYKLCEFKPVYGKIFEDHIQQYSFWGVCDIDLVLGRLGHFVTDELLSNTDVYSGISHYISGSFFLFRNTHKLNMLYENSVDFKQVFESEHYSFFDECGPVWHEVAGGKSLEEVDAGIDSITHVMKREERKGTIKTYFADHVLEKIANQLVLIKNGAVIMAGKEYLTLHFIYLKTTYYFFIPEWKIMPCDYFIDRLGFHPMTSLNLVRYAMDGSVGNKLKNKLNLLAKRVVKFDFVPSVVKEQRM